MSYELFEYIGIENLFFIDFKGITSLIRPIKITNEYINAFCSSTLPESGKIVIQYKNEKIEIFSKTMKLESGITRIEFEDILPTELSEKIRKLEKIEKNKENRTEERFEVGLEKWQDFGLSRPETIFIYGNNTQVKCIISNVSIHGALLIGSRSFVTIGTSIDFQCFINEQKIKLKGVIVNTKMLNNSYFQYSINFLEPISIKWCENIIKYSKKI